MTVIELHRRDEIVRQALTGTLDAYKEGLDITPVLYWLQGLMAEVRTCLCDCEREHPDELGICEVDADSRDVSRCSACHSAVVSAER